MQLNDFLLYLVCGVFVTASVYLAAKKELVKDTWSPAFQRLHPDGVHPYSLSRTQLFWWTLIIVVCCIVAFVKTGRIAFNTTALILFGVALTTTTGGRLIDKDQAAKTRLNRHQDQPSEGFWTDILSDENGISLHRFQTVVLNVLFGMVFLSTFFKNIQFPEFGDWELALLGVSSGGYLAVKINENPAPATTHGHPTGGDGTTVINGESGSGTHSSHPVPEVTSPSPAEVVIRSEIFGAYDIKVTRPADREGRAFHRLYINNKPIPVNYIPPADSYACHLFYGSYKSLSDLARDYVAANPTLEASTHGMHLENHG